MTYKNHLDDEIILIGTLKSVVLWIREAFVNAELSDCQKVLLLKIN